MNLYYELLQYPIFSMKELNALYLSERTARAALGKLLKENMVLKIRNGLYTCVSGENGGPVANRFQVASAITPSSYVSHHTAFEYYGTVDQVFYEVYVGSETRFHDFESEYQTELGISDDFIKICNDRSGNSKRYLTNGISEPGYSGEWKLVYPKNIKRMKNGGIEDAAI